MFNMFDGTRWRGVCRCRQGLARSGPAESQLLALKGWGTGQGLSKEEFVQYVTQNLARQSAAWDQLLQHRLGACRKCRLSGPVEAKPAL